MYLASLPNTCNDWGQPDLIDDHLWLQSFSLLLFLYLYIFMGYWSHVGSMCCLLILVVVVAEMMAHIRVTNHCCHWETRTVQGLSTADQTKTYFETSGKKFSTGAEIRATRDTVDDTHKEQIGPNIALMDQLLRCSNPPTPRVSCLFLYYDNCVCLSLTQNFNFHLNVME